jgi:RNA polymerase sigma factor (sigma-70 family)
MNAQTELPSVVTSVGNDSEAEQRYFGKAPLDEIRRELKHYGVAVEEIVTSIRTYLARKVADLLPPPVQTRKDDAEERYLEALPLIDRIAAFVARRARLSTDEAEDFRAEVRVRLFENNYAIIRKFEGRHSFSTYLTTVIYRLFRQYRVEQWGKWRPSAEAKRMGAQAIVLERLMTRDGFSYQEAVNVLTIRDGATVTASQLEAIYLHLPLRSPRPLLVSTDVFPEAVSMDSADDRVQQRDRVRNAQLVTAALDTLIGQMSAEDGLVLQMRFWQGMRVPDIARSLGIEQKKLYKRLDRLFMELRRSLENAGIDNSVVVDIISHSASDLPLASMPKRMQTASDQKLPA